MKKVIAMIVVAAFFAAAMPRLANAGHYYHQGHHNGHRGGGASPEALGIVMGGLVLLVAIPVAIGSFFGWKKHEKSEDTNQLVAKGTIPLSVPAAFNGIPGKVTWKTDTMERPVVLTYKQTSVQPITQNVRPLRSGRSDKSQSPLYRAGVKAAQEGNESARALCAGASTDNDFCRGFLSREEGRR